MNKYKYYASVIVGKLVFWLLKQTGRGGGTAAPGLYALRIDPQIAGKLASSLKYSVIITGTNGKTTTSRLISSILKQAKIPFLHNRTGSNLLRGVVSELLRAKKLKSNFAEFIGLWEVDEGALTPVLQQIKPKIIVITNLFRDQLDRYGEIDTILQKWQKALANLTKDTTVILNADDPNVASLGSQVKGKVFYFSLNDKTKGKKKADHAMDANLCPLCAGELKYETNFVSHLGVYSCLKCKFTRPQAQVFASQIAFSKERLKVKAVLNHKTLALTVNLAGLYNSYNVLAALAVCLNLNISLTNLKLGLSLFTPAFGRFEKIKMGERKLHILLVKNPTGFNQVVQLLPQLTNSRPYACLLVLNDLIADGRDVSWIWDVDFSHLSQKGLKQLIVSGTRAEDMALRLKYEGLEVKVINNLKTAVTKILGRQEKNLFILPTYTAMLETRRILNNKGLVHQTWED